MSHYDSAPSTAHPAKFNPDEIRRAVQRAKDRGLIHPAGTATPIAKNGQPAAALASVRSQWMQVDPDTARRWLNNNFRNRPIAEDTVNAYARDMLGGVWVPTHQGVAFNDREELIDGQHRLHAIIRSGITVRMMVTFGLPSHIQGREMTTMDAVDRGRTRTVADQLKIQHGFKHGGVIAGICAQIATLCNDTRTRRLSVQQTLEIYRAYEDQINHVIAHRSKEHGLRQIGVIAAFAFAMATEKKFVSGHIAPMLDQINTGQGIKPRSALARLRDFLISDEAKILTRGTNRGVAELVLHAILLQLAGNPVATLELSQDGAAHFRAAQKARVAKITAIFTIPAP